MKKYLTAVVILFLGLAFNNISIVNAASDYSPSITIITTKNNNNQVQPLANQQFTITPVTVKVIGNKIDLADPTTYQIIQRSLSKSYRTDSNGQLVISGATELPQGYYEIQEANHTSFLVSLPFHDADGKLQDDLVIKPKPSEVVPNLPVTDQNTQNKDKIFQTSGSINNSFLIAILLILSFSIIGGLLFVQSTKKQMSHK